MEDSLNFLVGVPRAVLSELMLNINGLEDAGNASAADLCTTVQDVFMSGIEDYLGEGEEVMVRPVNNNGALAFVISVPKAVIEDVALNDEGADIEGLQGINGEELSQIVHKIFVAGLDNCMGEADEVTVRFAGTGSK
jgi:hypothetical protein